MHKIKYLFIAIIILFTPIVANATKTLERSYLLQIINQLEAIKPLILAAKKEQLPNLRLQFHYTAYYDDGKKHNGLLEDINEIEQGIKEKLSQSSMEPHRFIPIKGDYISHERK